MKGQVAAKRILPESNGGIVMPPYLIFALVQYYRTDESG